MIIKGHKVGYGKPLICVSVTGTNKKDIEERFHQLSKIRIDAVEWRADFFDGFCDKKRVDEILDLAKKILKNKIFIYTIRTSDEGGAVSVDEESYNTSIMIAASHKTVDIIDCQINSISKPASLFKDIKAKGRIIVDNKAVKTIYYKKEVNISTKEEVVMAYKVAELLDVNFSKLNNYDLRNFWVINNPLVSKKKITDEEWKLLDERKITLDDIESYKRERITDKELSEYKDIDNRTE